MNAPDAAEWYALRAKPKAEHLAAAHVSRLDGVDVFCPRIRFEKTTRRGRVWFVEALFPGYLFARFDLAESLRAVQSSQQVSGLVHFGMDFPTLNRAAIEELRAEFPEGEPRVIVEPDEVAAGDEAEIIHGALEGLTVLITRVLPGQERVRILMDWLGGTREADVPIHAVIRKRS